MYGSLDEGARFSTSRGTNAKLMWSWADRFDGGIANGRVYFLGFKKHEPANGRLVFLDAQHWFDGRCWEPYRRP